MNAKKEHMESCCRYIRSLPEY